MSALKKCHYVEKTGSYLTPAGRITFFAVAEKWKDKAKPDDKGQYALTLISPPDADFSLLRKEAERVAKDRWGDKLPKGLKSPFLKADEKLDLKDEGIDLTGWTMIRANTYTSRPGVVDARGQPVEEGALAEEFYNGRWARMSVTAKAYDQQGNRGVKFYVNNIQLLHHDEQLPLGGVTRAKPEAEFEAVEGVDAGESSDGSAGSLFD